MGSETGSFYRLEATASLPESLRAGVPEVLWIPDAARVTAALPGRPALLGRALDAPQAAAVPLVSSAADGSLLPHFDPGRTADSILLERYHDGLPRTLEMRLPFNYSRLPGWIKALGRKLRGGGIAPTPELGFPADTALVEWLGALARSAGLPGSRRSLAGPWPEGCRAALVISHDVDTDWVFRNPGWLERICDLEEKYGLLGAWYCVPMNSRSRAAERGMERLLERGCEIGIHGYNHDAKWPFLAGRAFQGRLDVVRRFRDRWRVRGFRSEWLWRSPDFLSALAPEFDYDSSVFSTSSLFTRRTGNGCASVFPYRTWGGLLELPLTLPMDEDRHFRGLAPEPFWQGQVERAEAIIAAGGMVMLSLHPQGQQGANEVTLRALEGALERITAAPGLWRARPDRIADWVRERRPLSEIA